VFTLRDGGMATFMMAAQFAQHNQRLAEVWRREEDAAEERREAHWQEVLRRQALAATIRAQLAQMQADEDAARLQYNAVHGQHGWAYDQQVANCYAELQRAQRATMDTEVALKHALVPPPPVFQPLPRGLDGALRWLFFLYMPPLFR
jgi:crotonobetainyl-CoA:carnitine CoA-transferase CaiB-like acyl-CoA transferase